MRHIAKFETFINESKEDSKKPKSEYFTKRIPITKLDLEQICDNLGLPFENLKFLSSGSFGNAYKVGEKVLKISVDKTEAKSVYDLLQTGQSDAVIKYYDVSRYQMGKGFVYVIVMDYATPLVNHIKKIKDEDITEFLECCTDIFFGCWGKIESEKDFEERIQQEYNFDDLPKMAVQLVGRLWTLYDTLQYEFESCPDIHIHNIGIKDDGELVMFDYNSLETVRKFDQPRIIN